MNDKPWLDLNTIKWLDSKTFDQVFEWGSGGSTLFFSKKAKKVISVENDAKWFGELSKELTNRKILNVTLMFISHQGNGGNPLDLYGYTSNSQNFKNKKFETYAKAINQYPDEQFDLILVDGRARISCVAQAIPKVKKGGILILDDSHRSYYSPAIKILNRWECIEFKGPHRTKAWIKPKNWDKTLVADKWV